MVIKDIYKKLERDYTFSTYQEILSGIEGVNRRISSRNIYKVINIIKKNDFEKTKGEKNGRC